MRVWHSGTPLHVLAYGYAICDEDYTCKHVTRKVMQVCQIWMACARLTSAFGGEDADQAWR